MNNDNYIIQISSNSSKDEFCESLKELVLCYS